MITAPIVLVLASGSGNRFLASGGSCNKLDAKLGQKTVLEHTVHSVEMSGLQWLIVRNARGGMGSTIAAGVASTRDASGWLILPGDLPLVKPETIRAGLYIILCKRTIGRKLSPCPEPQ